MVGPGNSPLTTITGPVTPSGLRRVLEMVKSYVLVTPDELT